MGSESQLLHLYQQWRALTQAEAAAIQDGNWAKLLETQAQKKSLQQQIEQAEQALSPSVSVRVGPGPSVSSQGPPSFQATLNELILLEQQNSAALAARQQALQNEQRQLEKASSNLRQLHRAYTQTPASVWQSYS